MCSSEASERGIKMPFIFMITANNSSISSRLAGYSGDALSEAEEGIRKIEERIAHWGKARMGGKEGGALRCLNS